MKIFWNKYKKDKIKNFIKKNNFFLFFFKSCYNSNELIFCNQKLKIKNSNPLINSSKNLIENIYQNSIYIKFKILNSHFLILINLKSLFLCLKTRPSLLSLQVLAFKLNRQIYNIIQLKTNYSFYYFINKLILLKFSIVNLKLKSK